MAGKPGQPQIFPDVIPGPLVPSVPDVIVPDKSNPWDDPFPAGPAPADNPWNDPFPAQPLPDNF